jgi:hypothetical protein
MASSTEVIATQNQEIVTIKLTLSDYTEAIATGRLTYRTYTKGTDTLQAAKLFGCFSKLSSKRNKGFKIVNCLFIRFYNQYIIIRKFHPSNIITIIICLSSGVDMKMRMIIEIKFLLIKQISLYFFLSFIFSEQFK